MGRYRLVAAGEHAKTLKMFDGTPDLLCWTDRPILLGRAVKEGEGYKFPNHWNSLSSRHCSLAFQATEGEVRHTSCRRRARPVSWCGIQHKDQLCFLRPQGFGDRWCTNLLRCLLHSSCCTQWLVTDTSTNGTFINGVKIGKGNSAVLKPGETLGLSVVTNAAPAVTNFITVE